MRFSERKGRWLPVDPSTEEERREIVDALNQLADWFDNQEIFQWDRETEIGAFWQDVADGMRVIAGALHPDREGA